MAVKKREGGEGRRRGEGEFERVDQHPEGEGECGVKREMDLEI